MGFSEALRQELRPHGIDVSVLCPPDTDTPGFARENLTKPQETQAVSSGAKVMQPDEEACALLDGLRRGAFMVVPGAGGKSRCFLKRLAPSVADAGRGRPSAERKPGSDRLE